MGALLPACAAPAVSAEEEAGALPFQAFLDAAVVDYVVAVEIEAWSRSRAELVTLRLASRGFVTDGGDSPANTIFAGRLQQAGWARRTSGRRFGGESEFRNGSLRFSLGDRAITVDGLTYGTNSFLDDLAIDGRAIRIRALPKGTRWKDGMRLFTGTAKQMSRSSGTSVDVELRGSGWRLDVPLQASTFLGTGGLEGGAELEGKRKPVTLGSVFNFSPMALIAPERVYAWHYDGAGSRAPSNAVPAVRVGGVPLGFAADYATIALLRAASIAPGYYATCLAESAMRLGSDPLAAVTMDVEGGTFGGAFVELPGALLKVAATLYGPQFAESALDLGSFGNLDVTRPWPLGRYFPPEDSTTGAAFFSEVMASLEGAWGDKPTGELQVYAIALADGAAGAPVMEIRPRDVWRGSFSREPLPADIAPAVKEVTVGYARNLAPTADLPGSVQGEDRARLETEYLTVTASQTLPANIEAIRLRVDTLLTTREAAEAFAALLLDLGDGRKVRVQQTVSHRALGLDIAQHVAVTLPAEDLTRRSGRVLGLERDVLGHSSRVDVLLTPEPVVAVRRLSNGVVVRLSTGALIELRADA